MATDAEPPDAAARQDELEIVGRISASSNVALLVRRGPDSRYAVYKPVRGEAPLWDFPDGTLAGREVAAWLVSRAGGWDVVPRTELVDGPLGPGSVQDWVGDPFAPVADDLVVDVVPRGGVPDGWLPAFEGETPDGLPVVVVHAGDPDVRSLVVLDAVMNNSDRKGSHCLRGDDGRLWAIDHGVTFSAVPKLRTVLWGWAGELLDRSDVARLHRLATRLDDPADPLEGELLALLPRHDVLALRRRVSDLLREGRHPSPGTGWPAVPWPPL